MRTPRLLFLPLLCLLLLLGTGCQHRGIPCPTQHGRKTTVKSQGSAGLEAISVPRDKNGRVKKRKKLLHLF